MHIKPIAWGTQDAYEDSKEAQLSKRSRQLEAAERRICSWETAREHIEASAAAGAPDLITYLKSIQIHSNPFIEWI